MREAELLRQIETSVPQGLYCLGVLRVETVVLQPATRLMSKQVAMIASVDGLTSFMAGVRRCSNYSQETW